MHKRPFSRVQHKCRRRMVPEEPRGIQMSAFFFTPSNSMPDDKPTCFKHLQSR